MCLPRKTERLSSASGAQTWRLTAAIQHSSDKTGGGGGKKGQKLRGQLAWGTRCDAMRQQD